MTSSPPPTGPATGPEAPQTPDHHGAEYRADYGRPGAPRVTAEQVRDLTRLRRITTHRKVAGVAGGIARHLDIDPLIVRVAFVVLSLFGGAGLIVYAACWILLPEDGQQTTPLGLDERSRSVALILVGLLGLALLVGQWDWFWVPGPLVLVALVVFLVLSRRNETAPPGTPVGPPPGVPNAGPNAVTPEQRWTIPVPEAKPEPPQSPAPPAYATHYVRPKPRNPRKRGPKLFWFTMALVMLAVGVVGIIDVSGALVAGSTYPAVATGVIGLMLLVGAFWGRAGGLILVGLLTTTATAGALAVEKVDADSVTVRPGSADLVLDSYSFDAGEYTVDLTRVTDLEALDGRTIEVAGDIGEIRVIVPTDMDVTVDSRVDGPGGHTLFGHQSGGIDTSATQVQDGGTGVPEVTLDLRLDVGHIEVRTEPYQPSRENR